MSAVDLDAYFARIGYDGPRAPSLTTLRRIIASHARRIPFENVDVLLKRAIRLEPEALIDKLVHRRRGGYCFEQNSLLLAALRELGFRVTGLIGRVLWMRPDDEIGPRSHMLLRVELPQGPFLADVGFGGLTLTAPLRLGTEEEQATPHETHRLAAVGEEVELHARLGEDWTRLYRFSWQPQEPIDYVVANWYTATYPSALFPSNLLAARPDDDRRHALFNGALTIRWRDGREERREIEHAAELGDALRRHFHIAVPEEDVAGVAAAIRLGSMPAGERRPIEERRSA